MKAKEERMMAKASGKANEVHGHRITGRTFLHGNLLHLGNLFGNTQKEKVNMVSRMR